MTLSRMDECSPLPRVDAIEAAGHILSATLKDDLDRRGVSMTLSDNRAPMTECSPIELSIYSVSRKG
jgi:hypothetical protein